MVLAPPRPATHIIEEDRTNLTSPGGIGNLIISVASAADTIVPWSPNPLVRDKQLRYFWPTEPHFASALFTMVAQYTAFGVSLSGPPRMTKIAQSMLNNLQFGGGWEALILPLLVDYFCQDNGCFIEVVRADNSDPSSPVVSLNHLDSNRCWRTGVHETPVVYEDIKSNRHKLQWWQVIALCEMPAPIETAHGAGYSCLTRVLRSTQIMRDIGIVKHEKASGRFTRQVHLVSGVQTRIIEDAISQKQAAADDAGLLRYIQPIILASLDPTSRVSKETIDLASVPEEYDEEKSLQAYLTVLSMAFANDYSNFAPLPGAGLGTASQSKTMTMRSRGKGPGLFMKRIERIMNFHGLLPSTVTFKFGEQDAAEQMERTEVAKSRAEVREIRIRSGEITTEVARQLAVDDGDLDPRYLEMMREENATDELRQALETPLPADTDIKPGMAGPKEAPKAAPAEAAVPRPPNSNAKIPRNPATSQHRTPGGTPGRGRSA